MADAERSSARSGGWALIANGLMVSTIGCVLLMGVLTRTEHTVTRSDAGFELATIETVVGFEVGRQRQRGETMIPTAACERSVRGEQSCALLLDGGAGRSGRYPMPTEAEADRVADELRALQPGGTVRWDSSGSVTRDRTTGQLITSSLLVDLTGTGFFVALGVMLFGWGIATRRHDTGAEMKRSLWVRAPLVLVGFVLVTHIVLRVVG